MDYTHSFMNPFFTCISQNANLSLISFQRMIVPLTVHLHFKLKSSDSVVYLDEMLFVDITLLFSYVLQTSNQVTNVIFLICAVKSLLFPKKARAMVLFVVQKEVAGIIIIRQVCSRF